MIHSFGLLEFGLVLLAILAMCIFLYPLRQHKASLLWLPVILVLLAVAYLYWGGALSWREHLLREEKHQQAQNFLKSIHSPHELIEKLKERLKQNPQSAQGWYLLGRLYANQQDWPQAHTAFARAFQLQPNDVKTVINYVQSTREMHQQRLDSESRILLKHLLETQPNQPDALAMLAMDAFLHQNYAQAIYDWEQLLKMMPQDSKDAQAVRRAIAKAQLKKKQDQSLQ